MPAKKKKPKTRARGARRMRELGHVLVSVWLDAAENEVIEKAAKGCGKQVATYIRERVFQVAAGELELLAGVRSASRPA